MPRQVKNIQDKDLLRLLNTLGENTKTLRQKAKLSQQKLATASGLATSTISEIESGRAYNVQLATVTAIARQLKIDPVKLLH